LSPPRHSAPGRLLPTHASSFSLKAIAELQVTKAINEELVQRSKNIRRKATKKQLGEARVLTVEEALKLKADRAEKEDLEALQKARRAALRGKVTFAKLVWKEMPMGVDIFDVVEP
jgi:hypothetical protein